MICGLLLILNLFNPMLNQELVQSNEVDVNKVRYYTIRSEIYVVDNTQLESVSSSGYGNSSHPYIIEGWSITSSSANCIYIRSTTSYFTIRNCWLSGNSIPGVKGIYIDSVANGTCKIENCTIVNTNFYGIEIEDSHFVELINNTITNCNNEGIRLDYAYNTTLINNTSNENIYGIFLWFAHDSILIDNTFNENSYSGFYSYYSLKYTLINNTCSFNGGSGFYAYTSSYSVVKVNNNTAKGNVRAATIGSGSSFR